MSDELTDAYLDLMMGRGDREAAPGEQGTPDEWLDWTRSVLEDRAAWLGYWRRVQDSDELRDLPIWVRGAVAGERRYYELQVEDWQARLERRQRAAR